MKFHFHIILTLNSSIFLIFTLSLNSKIFFLFSLFILFFLLLLNTVGASQIIFLFFSLPSNTVRENFTLVGCCLSSVLIISPNQHPQFSIPKNKNIEPENTFNWKMFHFYHLLTIVTTTRQPTHNRITKKNTQIEILFSSTS